MKYMMTVYLDNDAEPLIIPFRTKKAAQYILECLNMPQRSIQFTDGNGDAHVIKTPFVIRVFMTKIEERSAE